MDTNTVGVLDTGDDELELRKRDLHKSDRFQVLHRSGENCLYRSRRLGVFSVVVVLPGGPSRFDITSLSFLQNQYFVQGYCMRMTTLLFQEVWG